MLLYGFVSEDWRTTGDVEFTPAGAWNKPVKGGYFAGYYNGKQNIVGRRLFIEV